MNFKEMVEQFQCIGCVVGTSTSCGNYTSDETPGDRCSSHTLGIYLPLKGFIALGLPTGFNLPGDCLDNEASQVHRRIHIRLWVKGTYPEWDVFNIPVWVKRDNGFLFVRTYMPRTNNSCVDVIEGGDTPLFCLPNIAIDVTNLKMI